MSALILDRTPRSGDYSEKHFGRTFNSKLWIKFTDNNEEEWVGCFSKQYPTADKVVTSSNNESAFILAGGNGYLIDIQTRELLHLIDDLPTIESLIHTTDPEYFILGACYCIYLFDTRKFIKQIDPGFTVDGIFFTDQRGKKAIGHLYAPAYSQNSNVSFEFSLENEAWTIDPNEKVELLGHVEVERPKEKVKSNGLLAKLFGRFTRKK
jgi:hypothetical protein